MVFSFQTQIFVKKCLPITFNKQIKACVLGDKISCYFSNKNNRNCKQYISFLKTGFNRIFVYNYWYRNLIQTLEFLTFNILLHIISEPKVIRK